jgi:hypothetical protein
MASIPEWGAAIGTVGTLAFGVGAYALDSAKRRKSSRQAQARLFDAWVDGARWADYPDPLTGTVTPKLLVKIALSNASGQSMRGVDAEVTFGNVPVPTPFLLYTIPPTAPDHLAYREIWLNVERTPEHANLSNTMLRGLLKLSMTFTDASGNRWHRTWSGDLQYRYNVTRPAKQADRRTTRSIFKKAS